MRDMSRAISAALMTTRDNPVYAFTNGDFVPTSSAQVERAVDPWRNGNASDSSPEDWEFDSPWVHFFSTPNYFFC